jgi:RNA-splicing ligase RtcB
LIDHPAEFDETFGKVVQWATDNRAVIHERLERVFGKTELILDLPHNTYEQLEDGTVIIRKGSVRMLPGELSALPSHMAGDVVLIQAKDKIAEILNSMSHGTGRTMSRSNSKSFADSFDYAGLRRSILIPEGIEDSSLRTDGPFAYRDLDECLDLIRDYVTVIGRFGVVGYMGHLG